MIINDPATAPPSTPALDTILLLAASKRLIALGTFAAMLLGLVVVLATKPVYTATATLMPPQAPQSSLSSMLGQLGGLASLGGAGSLLKNPSDLYVGILQSRTISDRAIEQFHLEERWHAHTMTAARKALDGHAQFEAAKNGLIQISVKDQDPKLASDLANFFVDGLYSVNSTLAVSEAGQRRLFFQRQIDEEKSALFAAEEDLKRTQQKTGLLTVTGQTELAVRNIAQSRAQISSLEVQLQGLLTFATNENPEVERVRSQLSTLRAQLARLEDSQKQALPGDTEISANQVPEGSLEYVRKLRNVKYHDTLFDLLSRQYEAARIDEAKSAPVLQVVDRSVPPDQKSGPPRLLILIGFTVAGFCISSAFVFLQGALRRAKQNTETGKKLKQLHESLPWLPL